MWRSPACAFHCSESTSFALGDRRPIDGQQDVAGANPRLRGGGSAGDLGRDDAGAALDPQHAVLDFVGGGALGDVGDAHRQQQQRRDDRQNRPRPLAPAWRLAGERGVTECRASKVRGNCKLSKRHTTWLGPHSSLNN